MCQRLFLLQIICLLLVRIVGKDTVNTLCGMSKRHFTVTTFLERLHELDCRPRTPARMQSAGRTRANNSLPGIDFSNHPDLAASQVRKQWDGGERRHTSPAGFQHLANDGIRDGPLEVKPHGIRIVRQAPATEIHIDGTMTSTGTTNRASGAKGMWQRSPSNGHPLVHSDCDSNPSTPVHFRPARRMADSPRAWLSADLIPREVPPSPRRQPEPMLRKEYRRVRRYAGEPTTPLSRRENLFPDFGHRAQVGEPKHYVQCVPKKAMTYVPTDCLDVGSVVPLVSPDRIPLTTRVRSPSRGYDVVTLIGGTSAPSSPRSKSFGATPLRHSEKKNRSSSPNILAWAQ